MIAGQGDTQLILQQLVETIKTTLRPSRCFGWLEGDIVAGEVTLEILSDPAWPAGLLIWDSPLGSELGPYCVCAIQPTRLRDELLGLGVRLLFQLTFQGARLGWLGIGSQRYCYTCVTDELTFLETVVQQTAVVVHASLLQARLSASLDQLQQAYRDLIQAREAERRQLSERLHDETLQQLADVAVRLGLLQSREPTGSSAGLVDLQERLAQADRRLREIVRGIHPAVLTDLGLVEGVIAYLETLDGTGESGPRRIVLQINGFDEERLPDQAIELTLYRFVQNATTNALIHGRPNQIQVTIAWQSGEMLVQVCDDGCGMQRTLAEAVQAGHFGLLSMRERIAAHGGRFHLESRPGRGTTVSGSILLDTPPPAPGRTARYVFDLAG